MVRGVEGAVVRGVAAVAWAGPVAAGAALARGSGCISMNAAGRRGAAGIRRGASWEAVVNHAEVKPRPFELRYARIAPRVHRAKPLSPAFLVVARPITLLPARPDPPGPVTWRRGGPKGRLSKWRGGRHPGPQQMGYAFLKAICTEVPRLGTSPTEASLPAIPPSVCTLGTLGSEKEVLLAQAW